MVDIPVLPDVGVVEEGHDTCVILAASVDVPHSCGVFSLVALVVDVVHGRIGGVENGVHGFALVVAVEAIVVQQACILEVVPHLLRVVRAVLEEFVVVVG